MNSLFASPNVQPIAPGDASILFWITFGTIIFVGISQILTVYITRKSLLFGVRIPEANIKDPRVLSLKNLYSMLIVISTATILVAFTFFLNGAESRVILMWSLLIYLPLLLVYSLVYIYCWRRALTLKNEKGWVVAKRLSAQISMSASRKKSIPYNLYVIPILIMAALSAYALSIFESLPEMLPTHFGLNMQPDAWAPKSLSVILFPLGMSIFLAGTFIFSNYAIVRQKLQVSVEKPELSYAQHREYRTLMGRVFAVSNFVFTLLFAMILLLTIEAIPSEYAGMVGFIMMVLTVVTTLALVIVGFKAGQGGANLNPQILPEDHVLAYGSEQIIAPETELFDRQDDQYWVLGTFYYNPADAALLIENRFGSNTGFNYARPLSWLITLLLIALVVIPVWWLFLQLP